MKIQIKITLAALALAVVVNSTRAANILWTNATGGNWSDTNNWNPNQTPGTTDVAVITNSGNYTVALDTSATVSGLVLGAASGGTQTFSVSGNNFTLNGTALVNSNGQFNLSGSGVLNGNAVLNGALNCSGGTLFGALTVSVGGSLNDTAPGVNFNGDILTNYGTVAWVSGDLNGDVSPQIYNYGLWNAQSDNSFFGRNTAGNTTFNNFGTFRKSAGSGTTTLNGNTIFNNSGALDIQSGTLVIQTGIGSGTCNIAGGAILSPASTYTFTNSTTFSGAGIINGFLIGDNTVFNGTLTSSGATMSGTVTIASNAVLNIGTSGLTLSGFYAGSATLTNYGTVAWGNGSMTGDHNPQIFNYGLWNAQADETFDGQGGSGTTTFNNFGIFRKSAGAGTTTVNVSTVFNNSGALDIQSGTLTIQKGASSGSITNGAIFSPGLNYAFTNSTVFSGAGIINGSLSGNNAVLNGTLTASGPTMYGTFTLASNSVLNIGASGLSFNGSIFTNQGTVAWTNGTLNGDVSPQIYNYGLWDAQGDNSFSGHQTSGNTTFINFGTYRKSAGSGTNALDGNTIFNNSGALDIRSGTLAIQTGGGSGNITNAAIFSPGSGYTFTNSTVFYGTGIVSGLLTGNNAIFSGTLTSAGATMSGTLTLATNTVLTIGAAGLTVNGSPSPAFLTNYGTVTWNTGALLGDNGPQIFNYGLWSVQGNNTFLGKQSSGTTTFNNFGTLRKSIATGTTTLGDFLNFNNTGTVDVQSGTVSFVVNPNLAGGTLKFGISSTNSFGNINFQATGATLAGTVSANLKNLFSPATNNSFAVLTYGSATGTFTNYNLPNLPGLIWQTNYGSTAFTLSVTNIAPSSFTPTAITASGGTFSFSFGTVAGQIYQIQSTTNLAPANWITNLTFQATNSSITFSNLINGSPQLFYRTVLQQ
jgi:hypothetical protein